MEPIITLTTNPSVDVQWDVDAMAPEKKLRSSNPRQFPGGGGINVARVINTLGGLSICIFTAGWFTGHFLRELVEHHGLLTRTIPIKDRTRVSSTVFDLASGEEYRITPPGPELAEPEWRACLNAPFELPADYIVATGSLPRGVPVDFYARIAHRAKQEGRRVILDTSGESLVAALEEGVYMFKPNLRELETLKGRTVGGEADLDAACRELIGAGKAEIVAVSLGRDGAFLAWEGGSKTLRSPEVEVKSAVGAGDSFVGGMTVGLVRGLPLQDAFALGVASGTATVLTAGSELCHRADVERFYVQMTGTPLDL